MRYSFFHKETGEIAQHVYVASPPEVEINTPPGHEPIEGAFDPLSQRVDVARLAEARAAHVAAGGRAEAFKARAEHVVDFQPPQPSPDHEWRAELRRWHPTAAAVERARKSAEAREGIAALLEKQHHIVRGVLLGRNTLTELQEIDEALAAASKDL